MCSASCSAPCCRSSRMRVAQRLERLELAHFLRELVVERQQLLAADALDRDVVVDRRAGELRHLVVGRVGDRERRASRRAACRSGGRRIPAGWRCCRARSRRSAASPACRRVSPGGGASPAAGSAGRAASASGPPAACRRLPPADPRPDASARRAAAAARAPDRRRPLRAPPAACAATGPCTRPDRSAASSRSRRRTSAAGLPRCTTSRMSGVATGSRPRSRSAVPTRRGIRSCATSYRIWSL